MFQNDAESLEVRKRAGSRPPSSNSATFCSDISIPGLRGGRGLWKSGVLPGSVLMPAQRPLLPLPWGGALDRVLSEPLLAGGLSLPVPLPNYGVPQRLPVFVIFCTPGQLILFWLNQILHFSPFFGQGKLFESTNCSPSCSPLNLQGLETCLACTGHPELMRWIACDHGRVI